MRKKFHFWKKLISLIYRLRLHCSAAFFEARRRIGVGESVFSLTLISPLCALFVPQPRVIQTVRCFLTLFSNLTSPVLFLNLVKFLWYFFEFKISHFFDFYSFFTNFDKFKNFPVAFLKSSLFFNYNDFFLFFLIEKLKPKIYPDNLHILQNIRLYYFSYNVFLKKIQYWI